MKFGQLSWLFLLVLTFRLLAEPQPYRQGLIRLFPSFYRRRIDEILRLCDRALQKWLARIFFNMFAIAIFSFIGLLILQIPLALSQATKEDKVIANQLEALLTPALTDRENYHRLH